MRPFGNPGVDTQPSRGDRQIEVTGLSSSLRVGDSLSFGSALQTTGDVDTAAIRYSWKLSGWIPWAPLFPGIQSRNGSPRNRGNTRLN